VGFAHARTAQGAVRRDLETSRSAICERERANVAEREGIPDGISRRFAMIRAALLTDAASGTWRASRFAAVRALLR
jgi:hypothetical protein